jgi:hypothetical protein
MTNFRHFCSAMGCTVSKTITSKKDVAATVVSEAETDKDIELPAPVPVYVGTGVSRFSKENRSVLFVFGTFDFIH